MPLLFTRSARRGQRLAGAVRSSDNALVTTLLSRHGAKHFVDWAPAPVRARGRPARRRRLRPRPPAVVSVAHPPRLSVSPLPASRVSARPSLQNGHTPLSYASQTGNLEAAVMLLNAGADPKRGSEARGWAAKTGGNGPRPRASVSAPSRLRF